MSSFATSELVLEDDKATLLLLANKFNKSPEWLKGDGLRGLTVENGRVTEVRWDNVGLGGYLDSSVGRLSALKTLSLSDNQIGGPLPPTLGRLSSLESLNLTRNVLTGEVPSEFAYLTNLHSIGLNINHLTKMPLGFTLNNYDKVQAKLWVTFRRAQVLYMLAVGAEIAIARRETASPIQVNVFLAFLGDHEFAFEQILSFFDPLYCCETDRNALLKCWETLGGDEDVLRQGAGKDVSRWLGLFVRDSRAISVDWGEKGLRGTLCADVGALTALRNLRLSANQITGAIPREIGLLKELSALRCEAR